MSERLFVAVAAFWLIAVTGGTVCAQEQARPSGEQPANVLEAFRDGQVHLALRYRYEFVDQDDIVADAHASTLRTALDYRTAQLRGFDFFIEAENVVSLGGDQYRDAGRPPRGNGVTDRPVVADPAGTDINQVMVRYRGHDTDVRFGRQEINIADQRFVGSVAFRQHHQTFTAINVSNSSLGPVDLQYVFNSDVYPVFGGSIDTANNFLHAAVDIGAVGILRIYGILLDFGDPQLASLSTNSFGTELAGAARLNDVVTAQYEVEYAHQTDAADNPRRIEANYVHLMGGLGIAKRVTARVGWELLGGSRTDGSLSTPLATLHKFNGWADKFLTTPPDGLKDLYVQLEGRAAMFAWTAAFHQFSADDVAATYGSEVDWQVSYPSPWGQTFAFTGAYYSADTFSVDTLKTWVTTTYTF